MKGVGTAPPTEPGTIVDDKFRVESVLGEGGMGVVVRALHLRLGTPVALKFLLADALADPVVVERFTREARAAARLTSDHVARVLDVGSNLGAPYMVMEYLEGETIAGALKRRGPLTIEESCGYMIQVCDALAEAHGLGIVHRDLKPANLFLAKRSNGKTVVKVLDFGISKVNADANATRVSELTMTTSLLGTPHYMSPEQIHSSRSVDARADIWSCGVCLYRMLTSKLPYDADNVVDLIKLILDAKAPDVRILRPEIPPGLAEIVARCLRFDVNTRWRSANELAHALAPYMEATARPPAPPAPAAMTMMSADAPTRVDASPAMHGRTQLTSTPPPPQASMAGYVVYPPPGPPGPSMPPMGPPSDPRTGGVGFGRTHMSAPPPARRSRLGPMVMVAFAIGLVVGGYFIVRARQARIRAALASQAPEPAPVPVPVPVVTETAPAPTPAPPPPAAVTVAATATAASNAAPSAKPHPAVKRPPAVSTATAAPPPPTGAIPDER